MKSTHLLSENPGLVPAAVPAARLRLTIRGIVQGVGFRPYIYNLAQRLHLTGHVLNTGTGVTVEIEGSSPALRAFLQALPREAPPLANITECHAASIPICRETEFRILHSLPAESAFALIPSDVCVCDACLADTLDPANRRFEYPFTNCTHCGPRYSIILDIPYDRPLTTMAGFPMCPACSREYRNPSNRRFHAQPNACPVCGPQLTLAPPIPGIATGDTHAILNHAAQRLLAGDILAIKALGGYQLACDARNQSAVTTLRARKHRSEKPLAIMVPDVATAERLCLVSPRERATLLSTERPIVLLRSQPNTPLAPAVSPGNPTTGVMLPSTPLHALLFHALQSLTAGPIPLVMTSGNLSEEPIAVDNDEATIRLAPLADLFLHHNRPIHTRVDDSVVRILDDCTLPIRRARGYAPQPIPLNLADAQILACGAQQKNTLCLTKAGFALPSQHIGDLENYETLTFFEQTCDRMRRLFHITPQAIAHDLHPGYLSTQWALRHADLPHIPVQHHHAHIAACMAEHNLHNRVIGVAWDGTGLGTDNTIWGGEFLLATLTAFERPAHFRPTLLPGGDTAVRQPWRIARSYLLDAFDGHPPALPSLAQLPAERIRVVDAMLRQRLNTVPTTSAGRLFDAVAAIIGLHNTVSYEGQAAIALEAIATEADLANATPYEFRLATGCTLQLDFRPTIRGLVEDVLHLTPQPLIAARFHATLIAAITHACRHIRQAAGVNQVCLSGGCFQNFILLRGSRNALQSAGFEVFFPHLLPANDGGIAVGQAAVACATLNAQNTTGASTCASPSQEK
jgi:hydrogenase maturation protein HypF